MPTINLKGNKIVADSFEGVSVNGDFDVTKFTDNSGGTASDTLAAITAGSSYAQADLTALKNAVASLAKKIDDIIDALSGN